MDLKPIHFFDEPIVPLFGILPSMEKKPGCPDAFLWRETTYKVVELLLEWHDYSRKGRMAKNMQPQHAVIASNRGSLGVGRDYFTVRMDTDQIFKLYYDRAPKDAFHRKGEWFVWGEMALEYY
jgi:hypothetical protein